MKPSSIYHLSGNKKLNLYTDEKEMIQEEIKKCSKCELCKLEINEIKPFDTYRFEKKKYFIIAQNPSFNRHGASYEIFDNEDNKNDKVFLEVLKKLNIYRDDCYVTNIVKCSTKHNLNPKEYIEKCINYLLREINIVKPEIIITLGSIAKEFLNSYRNENTKIISIYHPSYYLRINSFNLDSAVNNMYNDLKEKLK